MNNNILSKDKQAECLERAIKCAGGRYSEELNIQVDEPCRLMDIVLRDKNFFDLFKQAALNLGKISSNDLRIEEIKTSISDVQISIEGFLAGKDVSEKEWDNALQKCEIAYKILLNNKLDKSKVEEDRIHGYILNELMVAINDISALLSNSNKKLFMSNIALLYGEGGIGKTHLLCDYVKNKIVNRNIYLFLADDLPGNDPINAIANRLGFKEPAGFLRYLKKLKGQVNRICIIIDAINENPAMDWKSLERLSSGFGVSIILSIRSGYEKSTGIEKWDLPMIMHLGFSEGAQEWDAMIKYFQHYNLKDVAETPVLFNEFRNPLFLKIYCESYSGTKIEKRPRGNIMTNVFEQYVASKTRLIANDLGVSLGRKDVWNGIVKQMALFLGERSNDAARISREDLVMILSSNMKFSGKTDKVIELLCVNGILREVTRFDIKTGAKKGLDYEFTYQKFSDHLIVRFYLNSIGKMPTEDLLKHIRKGQLLKQALSRWNYGLIEALAIQIPERSRGTELCTIVPKKYLADDCLFEGILNSIIWRDIKSRVPYMDEGVLNVYLQRTVVSSSRMAKYLSCLLMVATVPNHPFSSRKFHQMMLNNKMPIRDSFWQEYLYYYATRDDGSFNRLCSWTFSGFCDGSSIAQKYSSALALAWFLASTNQSIRDRATFAIIKLLEGDIKNILSLIKDFERCDDPYIVERLYAIAYSFAIYERNQKNSFLKLVKYIDENVFRNESRTPNIIIDQYAKEIICLCQDRYQSLNNEIIKRCMPPYNYNTPLRKRVPSVKTILEKYGNDSIANDCRSIINSVLYPEGSVIADFGNYTMGSAFSNLSSIRLSSKISKDCYYYRSFIESLSHDQEYKLDEYRSKKYHSKDIVMPLLLFSKNRPMGGEAIPASVSVKEVEKSLKSFIASLSLSQKKLYKHISSYIAENKTPYDRYRKRKYDISYARRWIFQNVLDLGWSQKLHKDFDDAVSRFDHLQMSNNSGLRTERIGKKYQWISLFEFMAIESSKYYIFEDNYSDSCPIVYQDPLIFNERSYDPTIPYWLIVNKDGCIEDHYPSGFNDGLDVWWKPSLSIKDSQEWLLDQSDLLDIEDIIFPKKEGKKYTALINWPIWTKHSDERRMKELWLHLNSYVVKLEDLQIIQKWFNKSSISLLDDDLSLPFSYDDVFLGEILRKTPVFSHLYENEARLNYRTEKLPFGYYTTISEYSGESFELSRFLKARINMPSPFLRDFLNLRTTENMHFQNKDVDIFCPAVDEQMGAYILIADGNISKKLLDSGYTILWTMIGEKQDIGDIGNFHDGIRIESIAFIDETGQFRKMKRTEMISDYQNKVRNNKFSK